MPPDSNTEVLLNGVYQQAYQCLKLYNPGFEQPVDLPNDDTAVKLRWLLTPRNQAASSKKYLLLVVGGISSINFLNCLKACLPDDKAVVLILDTESEEITRHADTMNQGRTNKTLMLSRLDEARSGQLFCSRAFSGEKNTKGNAEPSMKNESEEKTKYNKTVYKITGGYPLAIVLLAGLLRFKEKHGQWEAKLQELSPQGPRAELPEEKCANPAARTEANLSTTTGTVIDRVFWASFDDLPKDIKSCFLYFAAFARHTYISAHEMVRMWVAEGFAVKPELGKTMEEQGEDYLKELVSRCLAQIVHANASRGIQNVRVHMRLHGFLRSEVREAGFIEIHDMHDAFVPQSARRIAFKSFDSRYTMPRNKFPKLRSFICNVAEGDKSSANTYDSGNTTSRWRCAGGAEVKKEDMDDIKFLNESKFLRVISIVGLKLEKLPKEIGDLIHLRYLLVRSSHLKALSSGIRRLLNLQTLDIRKTKVETIDPGFWRINVLRHVLAEILTLPETLEEELGELQTLHGVHPAMASNWSQQNCPLHKMTNLRSLELHGFVDATHGAALDNALAKMHILGHLKLKSDIIPKCVFVGRCLENLQTTQLDGALRWPTTDQEIKDIRKLRPNLMEVPLEGSNDAATELELIGYKRVPRRFKPVYRLPHYLPTFR
ncbi:hypothetical protein QYE76_000404 [Lolium multiflorum]|uniref:Uncharacterized protein n=1 Tax=Lolium multiflorum TaxID=4521 RepID=A0AAD8VXM7_LOLMU|nr:hypothetical protein QYE76_000404 [Lolium multiflorum]